MTVDMFAVDTQQNILFLTKDPYMRFVCIYINLMDYIVSIMTIGVVWFTVGDPNRPEGFDVHGST